MCGLVGIAGNLGSQDEATIKRLLLFDYLRGTDSTGLAAIGNNNDVKISKLATDPITLFDSKRFQDTCSGLKSKVFMGHNRAATRGGTNNFNAHPFEYDHVVGAHNGTLDHQSWTRLEEALGEKFAVDSQALIAAIARLGIKDAIELCTKGVDWHTGAWSLTWYDSNEGSLNFLRNEHRPMWLAYEEDFKRIFWASEWWMLDAAFRSSASGYKIYTEGAEKFKFFPTEEDIHYKFDVGLLLAGSSKKPKPKVQTVKGREPKPGAKADDPFGRHGSGCGFTMSDPKGVHTRELTEMGKNPSGTTSKKTRPSEKDNVIHWLGTPNSPFAGLIDEEKFNALAKYGCSWCQADVTYGDPGVTIYERDDMLLCSKCSGHDSDDTETANRIYVTPTNFVNLR